MTYNCVTHFTYVCFSYFEYKIEGSGETKWSNNKPCYLILKEEVAGAWGSAKGMDETPYPQTMEVDYVRIYQRNY